MALEDFCSTAAVPCQDYRFRFFTFNLANSLDLQTVEQIQGLRGEDLLTTLTAAQDDAEPDMIFVSFPESCMDPTQLHNQLEPLLPHYMLKLQSAVAEVRGMGNKVKVLLEDLAARHTGDMQTLLAYHRGRFQEDSNGTFGLLTDLTVAGLRVPNPKKSFLGRSLLAPGGLRFCFIGAHFPISRLAAILEAEDGQKGQCSTLEAAKRLWAGLLRSVLRSASKQLHLDRGTVLFLQGDLNSRTFLEGRGKDLLLEVLKDLPLQRAIQRGMDLPNGRWYEVACPDTAKGALQLPVTYKFIPTSEASAIRIGDVLEEAGKARLFPNAVSSGHSPKKYRETMVDAEDACSRWGLAFQKKKNFRPFRFPACPDRMIYWAPDVLAPRLFWEPYQGYRVNHEQRGSDHKPVWLDLLLRVAPAGSSQCEEAIDEDVADLEELGLPHEATGSRSWWPRRQECGWNWTPDNDAADCEICDVPFSFLRRRHHCRHCGRCICDTCSPVECWRIVPEIEATRPSRFCIECSRPPSEAADD